jgi:hypothetical protein
MMGVSNIISIRPATTPGISAHRLDTARIEARARDVLEPPGRPMPQRPFSARGNETLLIARP